MRLLGSKPTYTYCLAALSPPQDRRFCHSFMNFVTTLCFSLLLYLIKRFLSFFKSVCLYNSLLFLFSLSHSVPSLFWLLDTTAGIYVVSQKIPKKPIPLSLSLTHTYARTNAHTCTHPCVHTHTRTHPISLQLFDLLTRRQKISSSHLLFQL